MTLQADEVAKTVARCGAMRCGAGRCGFVPRDTINAAGTGPGPLYRWAVRLWSTITWTLVRS